jgi:arginine decarboxylase-like protein
MSDKEVEELIENTLKFRQAEVEIERKALAEYKKLLPIRKVALLLKAEKDFQREILKNLKKRRFEEE